MNIKEKWDDNDFSELSWHDSTIYSISFPNDELLLNLDIDYIFEWILNDESNLFEFYISPCILAFYDILNLNININFENSTGICIDDILRENPILSPNGKYTVWNYKIQTDKGYISFTSTGFDLILRQPPILSKDISLKR